MHSTNHMPNAASISGMNNPHIIVDPATKRCICGVYGTPDEHGITCALMLRDIYQLMFNMTASVIITEEDVVRLKRIAVIIQSLVEDRPC